MWLLPTALLADSQQAEAQSHASQKAHTDAKWAQEWRKTWLANHSGGAAAAVKPVAPKAAPTTPAASPIAANAATPPAAPTPASETPAPKSQPAPGVAPRSASSPIAGAKPVSSTLPVVGAGNVSGKTSAASVPVIHAPSTNPQSTNPQSTMHNPPATGVNPSVLAQTKPDIFTSPAPTSDGKSVESLTKNSPMASGGDSWKMVAYLVPVLLGIVGCLNLLKRFQARTGRLPGVLQSASRNTVGTARTKPKRGSGGVWNALIGSFQANHARKSAGSSMHLLESMPIGGANVHLLEVRGRVLLLGATPTGINLLTEFEEREGVASDGFRDLLHAAAADMDALDYEQDDLPATATVSTLEELMRETGQSVVSNARRLRTVREVDIDE